MIQQWESVDRPDGEFVRLTGLSKYDNFKVGDFVWVPELTSGLDYAYRRAQITYIRCGILFYEYCPEYTILGERYLEHDTLIYNNLDPEIIRLSQAEVDVIGTNFLSKSGKFIPIVEII